MTTSVNTGATTDPETTPSPEGHDEKMAQAYDDAQQQAAATDTTTSEEERGGEGEKILGKFNSQDELVEAYRNLEAKLSQGGRQDDTAEGTRQEDGGGDEGERQRAAEEAVSQADGVDMESLSKEYFDNGDLSDDSYEALEKAGIPRQVVQEYIEGQEVRAQQFQEKALESVGGEEEFQKMAEWASSNLSSDQLDAYNKAVDSGDPTRMQEAVQALAYQYSQARPSEPDLIGGKGPGGGEKFESVAQLTEAMSDPRYESDPAYRKQVEQKLANSEIF